MEKDEKLDLILNTLQKIESVTDKNKLHDLAKEHWGLVDNDIRIIELAKTILDRGKNNEGKVMQLVCEMSGVFDRLGEDGIKRLFTIEEKPNNSDLKGREYDTQMKSVIAKKDFYMGEVRTLQQGKEYKIIDESLNGVVIKNDLGGKQGFNKVSDWIEFK